MKNTIINKVVFATSATALITGVGAGAIAGPNAFNLVSSVSAAEVSANQGSLAVELISPPDGTTFVNGASATDPTATTVGSLTPVNVNWSWNVPNGTVGGDTTTFTAKYLSANTTQDITAADGTVIGTMVCTGVNNTDSECVVTYSDAVNGLTNVKANAKIAFNEKVPNNNKPYDTTITDGTNTVKVGTFTSNVVMPQKYGDWLRITQALQTNQKDLNVAGGPHQFTADDIGKTFTSTFKIPEDKQQYEKFNCDAITSSEGINYSWGSTPDASTSKPYALKGFQGVNGVTDPAKNPLNLQVVSCSETEVVISYVPNIDDTGFSMYLTQDKSSKGSAILLTDKAIAEKYTGEYQVTLQNSNGSPLKTAASPYDFNTGAGSGQVPPKATPDVKETNYNTPVSVDVTSNDTKGDGEIDKTKTKLVDADGNSVDTLTNTDGKYTIKDGVVTFTPATGKVGPAAPVDYRVFDSNGNIAQSTLTITVKEAVAPTAANDKATTEYNKPVTVNVLENDKLSSNDINWTKVDLKDPEGQLVSTLETEEGTFTVNEDNTVTFTPSKDFSGNVPAVSYQATDSNGKTATAEINVTVGENPNPASVKGENDKATTKENTPVTIDVFGNDTATNDTIKKDTLTLFDADGTPTDTVKVKGGTYTLSEDGKVVFTPEKGFNGEAGKVTYGAMTESGLEYKATVSVTVEKSATPPVKEDPKDDTPKEDNPPVKGPKVVTDFVGNTSGMDAAGLAGLGAITILGGAAALRRKRK